MKILLIVFYLAPPLTAMAQTMLPIYDGSQPSQPPRAISRTDQLLFRQQVVPAARRAWQSRQRECEDGWEGGPAVRATAIGSFTRPKVAQRALLYNYCTPAHAYAFNGVAIIENGRVVAHVIYQSDWQNDIATARDINRNGLSEIILIAGTTNQGTTWATMTLVELTDQGIHKFGYVQVLSDSCGINMTEGGESWKVFAKPGLTPAFYSQRFKRLCSQTRWRRASGAGEIQMDEDVTDYRRLKN